MKLKYKIFILLKNESEYYKLLDIILKVYFLIFICFILVFQVSKNKI